MVRFNGILHIGQKVVYTFFDVRMSARTFDKKKCKPGNEGCRFNSYYAYYKTCFNCPLGKIVRNYPRHSLY